MAVAPEKIKARLKALYPKANLSTKRLDVYAAKLAPKPADDADDEAIDAIINDYNEVIDFEAVAKEDDSNRTLLAKAKADADLAKGKGGDGKKDDTDNDDLDTDGMTPFEKTMLKKFGEIKSELDTIKSGNVKQSKLDQAKSLLEKSEVFKKLDEDTKGFMLKNVDLESETPFEEQITGLEGVFGKLVQSSADGGDYAGAPPVNGGKTEKFSEAEADAIVSEMRI
jgi:hypothetical protein